MKRLNEMTAAEINELWKNQTPIEFDGKSFFAKTDGRISHVAFKRNQEVEMVHVKWDFNKYQRLGNSTLNRPSDSYYADEADYNGLYVA